MRNLDQFARSIVHMVILITMSAGAFCQAEGPASSPEKEKELLAILTSDSPASEKAIACKQLAIYGSSESVPELAKLLTSPELASWARTAMEAIPGPEADSALRTATETLSGRLLVGTINSIGVRRDPMAVDSLGARLKDSDIQVASAAAVALGRIGSSEARQLLRQSLTSSNAEIRSAVAEGCVLCAEKLHSDGQSAEAVALYDEVRQADVPAQRIIEATRGAILARNQDGIPLLLEQLRSPDKGLFYVALSTAREFPGADVDQAMATELAGYPPERAALIIQAMADRSDTVVLTAILNAAEKGPETVRLSAIDALARVGNMTCLGSLLRIATEEKGEIADAAKAALGALPGESVDAEIVKLLGTAQNKTYLLLIELVGSRRIEAVSLLLKALDHSDKAVRRAALIALGETASLQQLSVLISQLVSPKHTEDSEVAQQALRAASIRMADREACAAQLATAADQTKQSAKKVSLLTILGEMGGPTALAALEKAAKSPDLQLQDISSRLMGEWMTEDAAPVLLELAKLPSNRYQIRAMRGYIRIARQFVLPDEKRMEMCGKALDAAQQVAEKKLVLDVLKRYPGTEAMKLAVKALQNPELKDEATQTILVIAQKLGSKGVDVKEMLASAGIEKMKLEIIKAEYGAGATQKDVTEILKKQISDLPLVTLTSATYNASFGGDPLPGNAKQLKIQYRLNGKAGEATFAENAVIILPMPK